MSQASQPTISFVLPMYEKMDRHLLRVSTSEKYSGLLSRAADAGREKLLKYKEIAVNNQFYTIATGVPPFLFFPAHKLRGFTVLHPYLRAEWFKNTIPTTTPNMQRATAEKAAITKAEMLFTYVAEQYKEAPASDEGEVAATATPSSRDGAGSGAAKNWLSDICDFEIAALPA